MPAIPIVVSAVISSTGIAAGMTAAISSVVGSTIIASAVTGAVIGGVSGAIGAAVQGQDVSQGFRSGLKYGAAGGAVSAALGGSAGAAKDLAGNTTYRGWQIPKTLQVSTETAGGRALTAGLGSTAGASAAGATGKQALQAGLLGGLSSYGAEKLVPREGAEKGLSGALRSSERQLAASGLRQGLQSTFGIDSSGPSGGARTATQPSVAPITGRAAQASPGTSALAQALRVGDAGGPIFGASGDEKGKKPGAWNIESLKYMGSEA